MSLRVKRRTSMPSLLIKEAEDDLKKVVDTFNKRFEGKLEGDRKAVYILPLKTEGGQRRLAIDVSAVSKEELTQLCIPLGINTPD